MVSTAGPRRTTRPRKSRASTANGRTVSSMDVAEGSRVGTAISGLVMSPYMGFGGLIASPSTLLAEAPGEDALLGMEPVFGLIEHDGLRPIDHLFGDLLATMGRQAMHEHGIGLRPRH